MIPFILLGRPDPLDEYPSGLGNPHFRALRLEQAQLKMAESSLPTSKFAQIGAMWELLVGTM